MPSDRFSQVSDRAVVSSDAKEKLAPSIRRVGKRALVTD
jgi:hypothetical protein